MGIPGDGSFQRHIEQISANTTRRSGGHERLAQLRNNAERERQDYLNDPTRTNRETIPTYSEATRDDMTFPKLSLLDKAQKKPVNLLETHITSTKSFVLSQESNQKTFDTLHNRGLVIKYWIDQNKSWLKATGISEDTYNQIRNELKSARIQVGSCLANEVQAASSGLYNIIGASSRPEQLEVAIDAYKTKFIGLLDVAHSLYRAKNGLSPLSIATRDLSPEEVERGAQGIQRMREEAERRQQQQEQQLQNLEQQDREHREEAERGNI